MGDTVERLRAIAIDARADGESAVAAAGECAADEIERLRAALANVVSKCSLACDVIEPDERGQKMQAAFRVIETYCLRALGHQPKEPDHA
jgi:hypothetical protein